MNGLDVIDDAMNGDKPGREDRRPNWAVELAPRRRANRRVQLVLVALVVAAVGFLGGILTTQHVDDGQSSSALPGGLQLPEGMTLPSGGMPAGASGGMPGAGQLAALAGGATTYTVTVVDGSTLYLKDTSGSTVKVVTLPSTTVRHLEKGTTADLRPGDTVTVTGDSDDTGTILAEAVDQAP